MTFLKPNHLLYHRNGQTFGFVCLFWLKPSYLYKSIVNYSWAISFFFCLPLYILEKVAQDGDGCTGRRCKDHLRITLISIFSFDIFDIFDMNFIKFQMIISRSRKVQIEQVREFGFWPTLFTIRSHKIVIPES